MVILLGNLFGAVFSNCMGNLVTEDDGKRGLVLRYGQETFVNDNLATGHTEGIDGVIFHKVKFPTEVLHFVGEAVFAEVGLDGGGEALSYALDEGSGVGVGRFLCGSHVVLVL